MAESTRDLLAAMKVPPALERALQAPAPPADIEAGQIWQVRWDDVSALVLVVNVMASEAGVVADAAAVTLAITKPAGSSVPTLDLETEALPSATLWSQASVQLPARVFERLLVPSEQARSAAESARAQRSERGLDTSVGSDGDAGAGFGLDVFDPGLDVLAELQDTLEGLATVPGLPVLASSSSDLAANMQGTTAEKLRALTEVLALPPQASHALLRGKAQPTPQQLAALAAAGVVPKEVAIAEAFPAEVVAELESPRTKAAIVTIAEARGMPEQEVRLRAAREAYALAARITGSADPVGDRVRHALSKLA